jgi:micrococcal nuclease
MSYRHKLPTTLLTLLLVAVAGISALWVPNERPTTPTETALVTRIIDGDTIVVNGQATIRLIGIDSPERDQDGYQKASEHLSELISNSFVDIEYDTSSTDPYGRTLGYIFQENIFINEQMVSEGFARATPVPPNTKHADRLYQAQQNAKQAQKGLWSTQ